MEPAELWLEKAKEDFDTAEFNKNNNKFSYAAFLYQQSVEKGLKAILLKQKKGLIKTHDCFSLAKEIGAPSLILEKTELISAYYFRTRYPDTNLIDLNKKDMERIANSAKEVMIWIQKQF